MADPGFLKREGRESKFRDAAPGLKKSLSGGGGGGKSDLHYGVGVPAAYQTDLQGEKKRKRKWPKGGGGGSAADSAPPPLDAPLMSVHNNLCMSSYQA